MIRITVLLWVALLVVAGGTVMNVSYRVSHVERHIAQLQRDAQREQEAIRILGAEWDALNDPQRIDALSKRYLASLGPTPIQRVVTVGDIPLKPSEEMLAKLESGQPANRQLANRKPEIAARPARPAATPVAAATPAIARAIAPAVAAAAPVADGVGLILARVERRE